MKNTRKISRWTVASFIFKAVSLAFILWIIASIVDVNAANSLGNPEVPATWNFFEVINNIFA